MSALAAKLLFGGMAVLFLGLGLLSHGCTVVLAGGGHVFGAEVAQGRIVEIHKRPSNNPGRRRGMVHEAQVEFRTADGRVFRQWDRTGRIGGGTGVGEAVEVYYDPAAPEAALLGGTAPFTLTPYVFELALGWIVVGLAAVAMVRGKKLAMSEATSKGPPARSRSPARRA